MKERGRREEGERKERGRREEGERKERGRRETWSLLVTDGAKWQNEVLTPASHTHLQFVTHFTPKSPKLWRSQRLVVYPDVVHHATKRVAEGIGCSNEHWT
jgi:hypothetical protein